MKSLYEDFSLSASVAGLIATLISFAGPLVIIFQAAESAGLSRAELSSWVWAIALGSALLGIGLSLRYRVPVVVAWSIPGSALLVGLLPQVGLAQAVGAYLVASLILLAIGLSGAFDRLIGRLPAAIAAGMQAGILFSFGAGLFLSLETQPALVLAMFVSYLVCRRLLPRYAVMAVLLVGCLVAFASGELRGEALEFGLATPVWTSPQFSLSATLNLALPLVLVALTGQFVPGMAVLRTAGFGTPVSPVITASALGSLLLAPFGCHGLNLAAVTASICTGREAHEQPQRRYVAALVGGLVYLLLGVFGATLVSLFAALPAELIAALAGLALFGAMGEALSRSVLQAEDRDAGLITFLVCASGMTFLGLSAAFWGLIFGIAAHLLLRTRRAPAAEVRDARRLGMER